MHSDLFLFIYVISVDDKKRKTFSFWSDGLGWLSRPRVHPSFPPVTSALWHTQTAGCDQSPVRDALLQTLIWAYMLGGDADWWGWRRKGCPCCFHERFLAEWIMKEWKLMLRIEHIAMSMWLHRKAVKIHKATWQFVHAFFVVVLYSQAAQLWAQFSKKRKSVPFLQCDCI